jgi:hypothetical protein
VNHFISGGFLSPIRPEQTPSAQINIHNKAVDTDKIQLSFLPGPAGVEIGRTIPFIPLPIDKSVGFAEILGSIAFNGAYDPLPTFEISVQGG